MPPLLLALSLALAPSVFGPPEPPPPERPAPPAAAQPSASAPLPIPAVPAVASPLGAFAAPAAALAMLAAGALFLARRRQVGGRLVRILETTSLGPRRALVVANLGEELLILGSSEAGITLLGTRPAASLQQPVPAPPPLAATERETVAGPPVGVARTLTALLHRQAAPARGATFDSLLTESAEDQELRRKLALGQGGSVR